jgi:serine protease Do
MGVVVSAVNPSLAQALGLPGGHGLYVVVVRDGLPAAIGGLRKVDIIESFNNSEMYSDDGFLNAVAAVLAGEMVPIQNWHDGKELTVSVHF